SHRGRKGEAAVGGEGGDWVGSALGGEELGTGRSPSQGRGSCVDLERAAGSEDKLQGRRRHGHRPQAERRVTGSIETERVGAPAQGRNLAPAFAVQGDGSLEDGRSRGVESAGEEGAQGDAEDAVPRPEGEPLAAPQLED